ncbi:disulfide-isomerase tigA [Xylona heveae TC161]|uniref:protein disulfide-isomerase n=1 Tax=Xylona heveae (strain CBS 132557 / TC161) TaxID=1328760 RepID=A0A165JSV3_XYLHT|nr:disulfide-isomerase tigA [Xylona heveae TC161]KZF26579.1 disulfide-isomerase tigA [Xylona heveae TC161]
MVRLSHLLASSLAVLGASAASAVVDLIPDNFDSVVLKSGKPALVEFFAPWCGHCKNLAPTYEKLAEAFTFAEDKVTIAKVDADAHRSLGQRFGVQGFPTLKWFDGKSDKPIEYNSGRDFESLEQFITDKTGLKAKVKKELPSNVQMLNDQSFKQEVGKDKDVLVAFTAPWCGHCKSLAPIWETLANDFQSEPTVLVAKVDAEAENAKALAQEQLIASYPTIKFFPKGSTEALPYNGDRSEKDFVDFLNEQAGTHRTVGGGLDIKAGTIDALDAVVAKFTGGETLAAVSEEAQKVAKDLKDTYAAYYVRVFNKIGASEDYAQKELKRLQGLLKKGGLAPAKVDDLVSRSNILRKFTATEQGKDEL